MQEERDFVTLTDENGNEMELDVIDYFFCDGQEYAVLTDADDDEGCDGCDVCDDASCDHDHEHTHEHEQQLYIMKVVTLEDDMEEFVPVEDELMEKLIAIVEKRFTEGDDEDDDSAE